MLIRQAVCTSVWRRRAVTAKPLRFAGYRVSVVNPAAVKAFAASRLTRTKTDKVDAELIARFCLAQQPPAPAVRGLQALVRRLESLIEMRVSEENPLSSGISIEAVRHSLEEHIAYLVAEIKQTELMIREHINNHPDLKEQRYSGVISLICQSTISNG